MEPYFEKLYIPILAADIIVSRAGSLSISEILAAKKPSILVPYPYAAHDHQRRNAREIEKLPLLYLINISTPYFVNGSAITFVHFCPLGVRSLI